MTPNHGYSVFALLLPEEASSVAARADQVFIALVVVSVLLVTLLAALNLYFLIRYRKGSNAPRPPLQVKTWKLEAGWISATTLTFLGFFFWGGTVFLDMMRPSSDAYEIHVVGRQWMWDARHPNGRREFDQVHVPVGWKIRLIMTSEDVIHSFYVPAFRLKQDVVPGKSVSLWFEATRAGRFHLFCAEFCGTKHSEMRGTIIALEPEAYADWLASGHSGDEAITRGRRLFLRHGCSGCHAPQSPIHAPVLEGLFNRLVPLDNQTFVRADDRYIRDSILQPQREIVAGYAPIMPSYDGVIPPNDLLDLAAYIKSLRDAPAPVASPQPVPPNLP